MTKPTLIHADSTQPRTVSEHYFEVSNDDNEQLVVFTIIETLYQDELEPSFRLDRDSIEFVVDAEEEYSEIYEPLGINGIRDLEQMAIDLLSKDGSAEN